MATCEPSRSLGFTIVELLVVMLIIAMLMSLLFPALAKAREAARRVECMSNLRQLGLSFENYDGDYGALPSIHRNAWWMASSYLAGEGFAVERDTDAGVTYSSLYTCPQDTFRGAEPRACSYGFNFQEAMAFRGEAWKYWAELYYGMDPQNHAWSPWSNYKLNLAGKLVREAWRCPYPCEYCDRYRWYQAQGLGTRSLSGSAPDTILMMERWGEWNQVLLCDPKGDLQADGGLPPITAGPEIGAPPDWTGCRYNSDWRYTYWIQFSPAPLLEAYFEPAGHGAGTVLDGNWVLRWDYYQPRGDPSGIREHGPYWPLWEYEYRQLETGRNVFLREDPYHGGRITTLFCDMHVEAVNTVRAFSHRPVIVYLNYPDLPNIEVRTPMWTRTVD